MGSGSRANAPGAGHHPARVMRVCALLLLVVAGGCVAVGLAGRLLSPDDCQANAVCRADLGVGRWLMQAKRYGAAVPVLKAARLCAPSDEDVQFRLAWCLYRTGDSAGARAIWLHLASRDGAIGVGSARLLQAHGGPHTPH